MNILISAIDSGGFGGAEVFEHLLAKYLKLKGIKTTLWVNLNSPMHKYLNIMKFKNVYFFPVRMDMVGNVRGFIKYFIYYPLAFIWSLIYLFKFKLSGGSHVIMTGFTDKILLSLPAKTLGLKVVWIEQGPYGDLMKRNLGIPGFIFKKTIGFCDLISVFTDNTLKKISKTFPNIGQKAKIIPCGIETLTKKELGEYKKYVLTYKKLNNLQTKTIIGFVSRIENNDAKGQEKLIGMAQLLRLKRDDFKVIIAGPGDYTKLRHLVRQLKLNKYVKLMGYVKDKYAVMSLFDIFIFPSTWDMEGFGIVPLEAMMMGVPVIASDHPPIPEVLGNAAYIVESNPDSLLKGVEHLLDNEKERLKYIQKGYKRIKQYNINRVVDRYLEELSLI